MILGRVCRDLTFSRVNWGRLYHTMLQFESGRPAQQFQRWKPPTGVGSLCGKAATFSSSSSSSSDGGKQFQYVAFGPSSSASKPSPARNSSIASSAQRSALPLGFNFQEKEGDLFSCPPTWSLAHCVSVDLRMGKGIAVLFRKNFQRVDELHRQGPKVGGCVQLENEGRFVYYLTTKQKCSDRPTYDTLRSSLQRMRDHCVEHRVTNLAMPAIGCGLDGLHWPKVKDMIREVFQDSHVSIVIYMLGKSDKNRSKGSPRVKRQRTV